MSLRRNRKRRSAGGALMSAVTLLSPAGRVAKGIAAANAIRSLRKRRRRRRRALADPPRRPLGLLVGLAAAAGLAALARRRRERRIEADYGPPNESVPSHETLAPARAAAAEADGNGGEPAEPPAAEAPADESPATESPAAEASDPPGKT